MVDRLHADGASIVAFDVTFPTPEKNSAVPILYGGSVNRGNAPQLLAATDVDGVLVGSASLDAEGWSAIVKA
jgi:triosephosphate isomerase